MHEHESPLEPTFSVEWELDQVHNLRNLVDTVKADKTLSVPEKNRLITEGGIQMGFDVEDIRHFRRERIIRGMAAKAEHDAKLEARSILRRRPR